MPEDPSTTKSKRSQKKEFSKVVFPNYKAFHQLESLRESIFLDYEWESSLESRQKLAEDKTHHIKIGVVQHVNQRKINKKMERNIFK